MQADVDRDPWPFIEQATRALSDLARRGLVVVSGRKLLLRGDFLAGEAER